MFVESFEIDGYSNYEILLHNYPETGPGTDWLTHTMATPTSYVCQHGDGMSFPCHLCLMRHRHGLDRHVQTCAPWRDAGTPTSAKSGHPNSPTSAAGNIFPTSFDSLVQTDDDDSACDTVKGLPCLQRALFLTPLNEDHRRQQK
jgi:hypothetical protein